MAGGGSIIGWQWRASTRSSPKNFQASIAQSHERPPQWKFRRDLLEPPSAAGANPFQMSDAVSLLCNLRYKRSAARAYLPGNSQYGMLPDMVAQPPTAEQREAIASLLASAHKAANSHNPLLLFRSWLLMAAVGHSAVAVLNEAAGGKTGFLQLVSALMSAAAIGLVVPRLFARLFDRLSSDNWGALVVSWILHFSPVEIEKPHRLPAEWKRGVTHTACYAAAAAPFWAAMGNITLFVYSVATLAQLLLVMEPLLELVVQKTQHFSGTADEREWEGLQVMYGAPGFMLRTWQSPNFPEIIPRLEPEASSLSEWKEALRPLMLELGRELRREAPSERMLKLTFN